MARVALLVLVAAVVIVLANYRSVSAAPISGSTDAADAYVGKLERRFGFGSGSSDEDTPAAGAKGKKGAKSGSAAPKTFGSLWDRLKAGAKSAAGGIKAFAGKAKDAIVKTGKQLGNSFKALLPMDSTANAY
jgi:hypothetical protein